MINKRTGRGWYLLSLASFWFLRQISAEGADIIAQENTYLKQKLVGLEERLLKLEQNHAAELNDLKIHYHQDRERLHHDLLCEINEKFQSSSLEVYEIIKRLETLEKQHAAAHEAVQKLAEDNSQQYRNLSTDLETRLRKDYFDEMGSMQLWLQQEYVRATDQVKREHKRALEELETRMLETHAKDLLSLKTEMVIAVNQHAETVAALDGKIDLCYNNQMQQANLTRLPDQSLPHPQPQRATSSLRGGTSPSSFFNPSQTSQAMLAPTDAILKLETTVASMQAQLTSFASSLKCLDFELSNESDLYFVGCNVHIRNGQGETLTKNSRGNLIIGYNEQTSNCGVSGSIYCKRSGSHNLVLGIANEYLNFGGVVTGHHNEVSGEFASVFGGTLNSAKGYHASVNGGMQNTAIGDNAFVSGGMGNAANGNFAQVLGGSKDCVAEGDFSTVVGGETNAVNAWFGTIIGGQANSANGQYSLIAGGSHDQTLNFRGATVVGGTGKSAEGEYVTLVGATVE